MCWQSKFKARNMQTSMIWRSCPSLEKIISFTSINIILFLSITTGFTASYDKANPSVHPGSYQDVWCYAVKGCNERNCTWDFLTYHICFVNHQYTDDNCDPRICYYYYPGRILTG
ncbi:hypothetical protein VTN96DRAFT_7495 [Rasamsonia emersonii]